ncbi:MAG: membrane dipeptidase [Deltaproteobacteria bacterium]|nr:membrane dipeptidase [Deltaproteobacteria bacterium]
MPLPLQTQDPAAWAARLGVSQEAVALVLSADLIDLHVVTELPARLLGYDPERRHPVASRPLPLMGQVDLPRLIEGGYNGAVWDVTTNPARRPEARQRATLANLQTIEARVRRHPDQLALVRTKADYDRARAAGRLALWPSLQGGNALAWDPSVLDGPVGQLLHRITLVHLTRSCLGSSSAPLGRAGGLTAKGADFIAHCNGARVLVDLAHASPRTFWEALEVHAADVPPMVSHTGVSGVLPHWRNLDDRQIRAIADRGGVIGVIYASAFLDGRPMGRRAALIDHLEHLIRIGGEELAALGSDYDGFILLPRDLPDPTHHPALVQDMLDRGWSEARIRRVLGGNQLRLVADVRPS